MKKKHIKGMLIVLNKAIWRLSDSTIRTIVYEANTISRLGGNFSFDSRKGVTFKKYKTKK